MFKQKKWLIWVFLLFLCIFLSVSFVSADDNITDDELQFYDCDDSVVSLDQSNEDYSFSDFQKLINNSTCGEINLNNDYTYHEGDNPIVIDKSIVINGNNHTFNALNKSSIFNIKSNDVVIRNLNFLNAGCGEFNLSTYGNSFYAVIVDDFNVFKDYTDYLITNPNHQIGSAIYSSADSLVISDCKFENNHASLGGAIYSNCRNLFIENVDFINNQAYCGAAIYLNGNNSTIYNSRFLNNTSSSFGAGIYQTKYDNVKIINSTFLNNHGEDNSTLFLWGYWEFSQINSTYYESFINFKYSDIPQFGVENIYNDTYELMIKFPYSAGVANKSFCLKINNEIYNLTVNKDGFTILKFNSTLKNCTLLLFNPIINSSYSASTDLCNNSFYSLQKLIDSQSEINLTKDYRFYDGNTIIEIVKPIIINGNGHVIDARGKSGIFKILSDNVIIKNITFINANGNQVTRHVNELIIDFYFDSDPSYILGYDGYDAVSYNSGKFHDDSYVGMFTSLRGGAIYCSGNNLKIINSSFINNFASSGGGIYIEGNNSQLIDLIFINNTAKEGGAIFNSGKGTFIFQCQFYHNHARFAGDSICCFNDINIQKCYFTNDSEVIFCNGVSNNQVINWQMDYMTSAYFDSFVKFGRINFKFNLTHLHDNYYNLKITFGYRYYWNSDGFSEDGRFSPNRKFCLNIDGKVYYLKTDAKSQADLNLKLTNGVHFIEVYNPITKLNISKIFNVSDSFISCIKKYAPKLIAKNKVFNKRNKTKVYYVVLKNKKGKAIKNVCITLKINGKIFKVKTNKNGKAVFKIKKLNKKGKYKATILFKGNNLFNRISKKIKIVIK